MASVILDEQATVVRPGDTLIFRFGPDHKHMTDEAADQVKAKVRKFLPEGVEILIVTGEVEQILVVRP